MNRVTMILNTVTLLSLVALAPQSAHGQSACSIYPASCLSPNSIVSVAIDDVSRARQHQGDIRMSFKINTDVTPLAGIQVKLSYSISPDVPGFISGTTGWVSAGTLGSDWTKTNRIMNGTDFTYNQMTVSTTVPSGSYLKGVSLVSLEVRQMVTATVPSSYSKLAVFEFNPLDAVKAVQDPGGTMMSYTVNALRTRMQDVEVSLDYQLLDGTSGTTGWVNAETGIGSDWTKQAPYQLVGVDHPQITYFSRGFANASYLQYMKVVTLRIRTVNRHFQKSTTFYPY